MPGANKDHIEIRAYENSLQIFSDHPQRRYQVINIPQVAGIKTIRPTYKNGTVEIVFKKKEKPKLNNKRRPRITYKFDIIYCGVFNHTIVLESLP